MTSKTVKSPAGDTIEIVPDDDWMALTSTDERAMRQWNMSRRPVLGALWKHGEFSDADGRASQKLVDMAWTLGLEGGKASGSPTGALWSVFSHPAVAPTIERKINGKRCYAIRLVALPEMWHNRLAREFGTTNGHKATPAKAVNGTPAPLITDETVAAPVLPDESMPTLPPPDEPVPDYGPPVDLHIASSVAMALLTQVVEIISTGPVDHAKVRKLETDLSEVADKLAKRLSENDSMRKSIRDLGEEVMALRTERDGLRKRLHMAESNLAKATSADAQRFINERVQQELAKVMRAAPVGPTSHATKD